jgi:FkbM family methyltransferase
MDASVQTQAGIVATYHGIRVPAAPHLGPGMIASMAAGNYERHEVQAALAQVPKGARILELGAGSGVVGAIVARHCQPGAMLSVEANPHLLPHIQALYAENGLTGVMQLRHGAVFSDPDAPETAQLFVRGNFLGSGLTEPQRGAVQPVQVPVIRYAELRAEFPHDVILMDIEGAERELLRHADLSGVSLLIGEFHRHIFGRDGMRECRALLTAQGLTMDEAASAAGVHVWRRAA